MEYGTPILDLIQGDWEVFSERVIETDRAAAPLEAIVHSGWDDDDGVPPLGAFDPYVARHRRWTHDTLDQIWEEFAEKVMADPSHKLEFRDPDFDSFLLREDLVGRRTVPIPPGHTFYRARLGAVREPDGVQPYSGYAIGAPPSEKAGPGRANPKGKAEELGRPLRYRDDPTDYIPSQKLAELIETTHVHGIRYPTEGDTAELSPHRVALPFLESQGQPCLKSAQRL